MFNDLYNFIQHIDSENFSSVKSTLLSTKYLEKITCYTNLQHLTYCFQLQINCKKNENQNIKMISYCFTLGNKSSHILHTYINQKENCLGLYAVCTHVQKANLFSSTDIMNWK